MSRLYNAGMSLFKWVLPSKYSETEKDEIADRFVWLADNRSINDAVEFAKKYSANSPLYKLIVGNLAVRVLRTIQIITR